MKTESDWTEKKVLKAFKNSAFDIEKSHIQIFNEKNIIKYPFVKYKITSNNSSVYLILVQYETGLSAIGNATKTANQFRSSDDKYVSSGVNGNVLSLIVSSIEDKNINKSAFDILKKV